MLRTRFEQMVVRAVVERSFCTRLLANPVAVLADYGVEEGETKLFEDLHAQSLEELTAHLLRIGVETWGTKVPGLGHYWDDELDVFTYRAMVTCYDYPGLVPLRFSVPPWPM